MKYCMLCATSKNTLSQYDSFFCLLTSQLEVGAVEVGEVAGVVVGEVMVGVEVRNRIPCLIRLPSLFIVSLKFLILLR